jgi:hypothetical protein
VGFRMTPLQIMPTGQCTTARLTSNSDLSCGFFGTLEVGARFNIWGGITQVRRVFD